MKETPSTGPSGLFLQTFSATVHKWTTWKSGCAALAILLFALSLIFLVIGKEGFAALSFTFSVISCFVLYSLSYTLKELVLIKALECKQAIELLYDLEKLDQLQACVEQYYLLASGARKSAFQYESDQAIASFHALLHRMKRFFCWKEFHILEEIALLAAIDLLTRQIRSTPCDVQLHAKLASTFILLQNHYLEPIKAKELMVAPSLFITGRQKELLTKKASQASRLAVEELEIMSSYAPDEVWVHEQLAISYRELHMEQKEIGECEQILALCPDDPQVLLRLGSLYFKTGQNGKGLRMYAILKELNPQFGGELIAHYGSYTPFLQLETAPE